jgi:hypothetical protein
LVDAQQAVSRGIFSCHAEKASCISTRSIWGSATGIALPIFVRVTCKYVH